MANAAITIDLNAKIAQFETELKRATGTLDKFGQKGDRIASGFKSALAGLGAGLSVGVLAGFVKSSIDAQDAISKLSQRTGIAVESLAGLQHAAELSDVGVEQLAKGVRTFSVTIDEAARGSKSYQDKIASLGLDFKKLKDLAPEEQFYQLADAVSKLSKEDRAAAVAGALGDRMSVLVPLLSGGADGLRQMVEEGKKYNPVTEESARLAEEFNDNLTRLKAAAGQAGVRIASDLVPSLAATAQRVRELLDEDKGVQALVRAFAGIGKIPFDLIFGDIRVVDNAKDRIKELQIELGELERKKASGNGPLLQKLFGSPAELDQQIAVIKNQIAVLEKFGDKIYAKPKKDEKQAGFGGVDLGSEKAAKTAKTIDKAAILAADMADAWKEADRELKQYLDDEQFIAQGDLERSAAINAIAQDWIDAGAALKQEMLTPLEKFDQRLEYINELFRRGVIDVETYDRAFEAAFDEGNQKLEKTKSLAEEIGLTFTSAFEDAIVSGKDFGDVLKGIEQDIIRIIARKSVTEPLANAFGSFDIGSIFSSIFGNANGNVFANAPGLSAYSGSVVSRPTVFPFANGIGLMGEAGAEAILPLKRGSDGKLGVAGGGTAIQINVNNNAAGTQATATTRDEGGVQMIDIMVETVEGKMIRNLSAGRGMAPALEKRYGLNGAAGSFR